MTKQNLDNLIISPEIWSEKLEIQPGDLSLFAPYGNGVYGYKNKSLEPIIGAPVQEKSGGIIYFGNSIKNEDFYGFLKMLNIRTEKKDYVAFIQESNNPLEDRYFKQMRLVSKFGLRFMYGAIDKNEYDSFKEQKLSIKEALVEFMNSEKDRFGTHFGDPKIEGKMGGDGNYAREELSFGFMLENDYNQVYRIWSRAWLVTK